MQIHQLSKYLWLTIAILFSIFTATAQENRPLTIIWTVKSETRTALVYLPESAKTQNTPIIFAFHGHGGTMLNMYNTRGFQKLWPEAIVVCPQGLNTVGLLTDPEGKKSGWSMDPITESNRDLQFFDAMLHKLRADYKIDNHRIYATGHSNGGGFTYLLWAARPNEFTAFAPTATAAGRLTKQLKTPKPAFHLMGKKDPLVKPIMQKLTYNWILKLNECEDIGVQIDSNITHYSSKNGNDVLLFFHEDGHQYPRTANAAIISFFKSQKRLK